MADSKTIDSRIVFSLRKEWSVRLILIIFSLSVALVSAELILRSFFPFLSYGYPRGLFLSDEYIEYRFKANYDDGYVTKQEFSTLVQTNSKGFRDREREYARRENSIRILSVGDSFTWGAYGVEMDETFSAQLEQFLGETFPDRTVEVLNTGVFGWGTDNELRFYKAEGVKYKPDVVMVNFFIGNDFYNNRVWGEISVVDGDLVNTNSVPTSTSTVKEVRYLLTKYSYLYVLIERSLFSTPVVQQILTRFTTGGESQHVYGEEFFDALIDNHENEIYEDMFAKSEELIVEFAKESHDNGSTFVLLIIPAIYQIDPETKEYLVENFRADFDSITKTQRDLKALADREGFIVIDLLPRLEKEHLEGRLVYWKFNPHFNHHGNIVVAEAIRDQLLESGIFDQLP